MLRESILIKFLIEDNMNCQLIIVYKNDSQKKTNVQTCTNIRYT